MIFHMSYDIQEQTLGVSSYYLYHYSDSSLYYMKAKLILDNQYCSINYYSSSQGFFLIYGAICYG